MQATNWLEVVLLCSIAGLVSAVYLILYFGYRTLLGQKLTQVRVVFRADAVIETIEGLKSKINYEEFASRYTGLKIYLIPMLLCSFTTLLVCIFFLAEHDLIPVSIRLGPERFAVYAGFAGTYLWSLYDLLRRYRLIDFTSGTYYHVFISLLLGLIVGYVFSLVFKGPSDIFLAFCVGALPLELVRNYFVNEGSRQLNFKLPVATLKGEEESLGYLQGATAEVIARLGEENIFSAHHLALTNPLKIFFRTNLDLAVILDLIDQAILYIYIEKRIVQARTMNMRSATAIEKISDLLSSRNVESRTRGEALVQELAMKLGESEATVREMVVLIGANEQVHLIGDLLYEAQLN